MSRSHPTEGVLIGQMCWCLAVRSCKQHYMYLWAAARVAGQQLQLQGL